MQRGGENFPADLPFFLKDGIIRVCARGADKIIKKEENEFELVL